MSLREYAESLGIKVDGRWNDERVKTEVEGAGYAAFDANIDVKAGPKVEGADVIDEPINNAPANKFEDPIYASERAAKIWAGQSASLSIIERVGRIRMALKDKGFTRFDELVIPTKEDYKKYL